MPAQMDLAHKVMREAVDIVVPAGLPVGAGDIDVVDVQKQPAAGAPGDLGQEVDLIEVRFGEIDIDGGVFQQHLPPDDLLHAVDMVDYPRQCRVGIGQGQKIVQELRPVGRPGEVLGKACRVQPVAKPFQPSEVVPVERPLATDGKADAVDRDRKLLGKVAKLGERAAAIAHVILGMHLKPGDRGGVVQNVGEMLRLVADARFRGQVRTGFRVEHRGPLMPFGGLSPRRGWRREGWSGRDQPCGRSRSSSSREPMRPSGSSIVVQVPAGTSLKALP